MNINQYSFDDKAMHDADRAWRRKKPWGKDRDDFLRPGGTVCNEAAWAAYCEQLCKCGHPLNGHKTYRGRQPYCFTCDCQQMEIA